MAQPYITRSKMKQLLNAPNESVMLEAWVRDPFLFAEVKKTLVKEGEKLTNHKNDRGGLTKWGLTETKARELGYEGEMADITEDKAGLVVAYEFYFRPRFNLLADIVGEAFAFEAMEAGYLLGAGGVVRLIQRFLNAMNRQERDWPDISVDGAIGLGETVPALRAAVNKRGHEVMFKHLRGSLYHHFLTLTEADRTQEDFFNGWVNKRINM